MIIALGSDLHVDWDDYEVVSSLIDSSTFDVLCLCGDFGEVADPRWEPALRKVCWNADPKPVLFVLGNHEAYGSSVDAARSAARAMEGSISNLHVLDGNLVEIEGQRFLGCTLWYDKAPSTNWSDFRDIEGHTLESVGVLAAQDHAFLERELQKGDIVLTHMLPSFESIHQKWIGSRGNAFFLHNIEDLILSREPKAVLHGHTHERINARIGETKIIAHPRGYPYEDTYENWRPLLLEM